MSAIKTKSTSDSTGEDSVNQVCIKTAPGDVADNGRICVGAGFRLPATRG